MAAKSGLLYVTMQPKPSLTPEKFNDWYNNEHGPNRLRLPFFKSGYRYKATDGQQPEYMAMYDVSDMEFLVQDIYTCLRAPPVQSERERETMKQISIVRRFYDNVASAIVYPEGPSYLIVSLARGAAASDPSFDACSSSYQSLPGWRSSTRFVTSTLDNVETQESMLIHDFSTPMDPSSIKVPSGEGITTRLYQRFYTFGSMARHLASPAPTVFPCHPVGTSRTSPGRIDSFLRLPDGTHLSYTLRGSSEADAPLIICVPSILATHDIYTSFIDVFLAAHPQYRILAYSPRGVRSPSVSTPITVDVLADDVRAILSAIKAPKYAAVIGVSLGGATALRFALKHPEYVDKFISCDTNSSAPPSNPKAWEERIALAEGDATSDGSVGPSLAEITVARWFAGDHNAQLGKDIKEMVSRNSLSGFKSAVKALYSYDFREEMKSATANGAFVVGAQDGVLPKTMATMRDDYGDGSAGFEVIEGAGHLPMVEQPEKFAEVVAKVLAA